MLPSDEANEGYLVGKMQVGDGLPMHLRLQLLVCCAAVTGAGALGAAEIRPFSLEEVSRSAIEHNHDLIAAGDGVAAALAIRISAAEIQNPTLSASLSKVPMNAGSSVNQGALWVRTYDWVFQLQQLVELGGKRGKRRDSAVFGLRVADEQRRDAERTLHAAVALAYVQVLAAEDRRRIGEQEAAALDQEAAIAAKRHTAGDLALVEAEQIAATAVLRRIDVESASGDEHAARIALQVVAGLDSADGWRLSDGLEVVLKRVMPSPGDEVERPDVAAAKRAEEKAAADLSVAEAGRIPDPTIGVQFEHNPPETGAQGDSVGISVSIPLSVFNQNGGAVAAADAAVVAASHAHRRAEVMAAAEVAQARSAATTAVAKLRLWHEGVLPKADHAWEAVSFAYSNGSASLLDLLSASRARDDARLGEAQARADAASAAINLRAALGLPATFNRTFP